MGVSVYFQSTSSLLQVYFQFSTRLHQLPRVHFCVNFFLSVNCGFGQYILFWLICLKPYCLKIWLNHFCTSLLPVSSSLLPVYFKFVPVYLQSTASLLPVYFQFSSRLQ